MNASGGRTIEMKESERVMNGSKRSLIYPRFGGFEICGREKDRSEKKEGNRSVLEAHDDDVHPSLHDHTTIMFISETRGILFYYIHGVMYM